MAGSLLGLSAVVGLSAPTAAAEPACALHQIAAIPVRWVGSAVVMTAAIGGKPVTLIADTGSARSILLVSAARRLGLNPVYEDGDFIGVGGRRSVMRVTAPDFQLGDSKPMNVPFRAIDTRPLPGDAVGLMGLDFFGQAETEFDLRGGYIRLFQSDHCERHNLAYWTTAPSVADMRAGGLGVGSFDLEVRLNGHPIEATLDSGAALTVVAGEAAQRVGGRPVGGQGSLRGIGAETVDLHAMAFDTVEVGEEAVKGAVLPTGDLFGASAEAETGSHIAVAAGPEMLLGADFLRAHRVIISRTQRRMYFTYVGGPVFGPPKPEVASRPPPPPPSPPPSPQ